MRKTSLRLAAGSIFIVLWHSAPAMAQTCSSERAACESRCRGSYGFTGEKLNWCVNTACHDEWQRCLRTGEWRIARTKETKQLRRE